MNTVWPCSNYSNSSLSPYMMSGFTPVHKLPPCYQISPYPWLVPRTSKRVCNAFEKTKKTDTSSKMASRIRQDTSFIGSCNTTDVSTPCSCIERGHRSLYLIPNPLFGSHSQGLASSTHAHDAKARRPATWSKYRRKSLLYLTWIQSAVVLLGIAVPIGAGCKAVKRWRWESTPPGREVAQV